MNTIEKAYEKYIIKSEKNATNDGVSTDKGRFVILFNETQNRFIENLLDRRGDDDLRYIQKFLILNNKITSFSKNFNVCSFELPKNYLDISNVYANASNEDCKDRQIDLYPQKNEDLTQMLQDPYNKPSFKWAESLYTINSDNISVYTDDFDVNYIVLSYYRYPNSIEQINPADPESDFNESIPQEWDDKSLDRIITLMVSNYLLSEQNPAYQAQKQQATNKN